MKNVYGFIAKAAQSPMSLAILIAFCVLSFVAGQELNDMNLFAASGGVMTIAGLLSLIRFTTLDKLLNQEAIIEGATGLTGPPVSEKEAEEITARTRAAAMIRIKAELRSELIGLSLTFVGTVVWAYGAYVPRHFFN